MSKFGIDVSQHQGTINWNVVKPNINFAILRLGWIGNKNNHTLDTQFERNYAECKRLNIPVGVYVYCYSSSEETVKSGANWTIEKLKGKTLELPVYIDMEDASIKGKGKTVLTNMCIAFNSIIEANDRWAGVYANLDWFNNYLNKDEIRKRYTTWIAHYGVAQNRYEGQYDILQYSSSGKVEGISGNVDVNVMYRDLINEISFKAPPKTIDELAQEVLDGKHGNGEDRKKSLGASYNEVQARVNEILKAKEVKKTTTKTYTVKKGDNLSTIAEKYNTTYQKIASDNGIKDPDKIYAGQKLIIK